MKKNSCGTGWDAFEPNNGFYDENLKKYIFLEELGILSADNERQSTQYHLSKLNSPQSKGGF